MQREIQSIFCTDFINKTHKFIIEFIRRNASGLKILQTLFSFLMSEHIDGTELPLDNTTEMYVPKALSYSLKYSLRTDQFKKKPKFSLWNRNCTEKFTSPYTLLFCLHKEEEQVKHKRDKIRISWAVPHTLFKLHLEYCEWWWMTHLRNYAEIITNRNPFLITVRPPLSKCIQFKLEGQTQKWPLDFGLKMLVDSITILSYAFITQRSIYHCTRAFLNFNTVFRLLATGV